MIGFWALHMFVLEMHIFVLEMHIFRPINHFYVGYVVKVVYMSGKWGYVWENYEICAMCCDMACDMRPFFLIWRKIWRYVWDFRKIWGRHLEDMPKLCGWWRRICRHMWRLCKISANLHGKRWHLDAIIIPRVLGWFWAYFGTFHFGGCWGTQISVAVRGQ